MSSTILTCQYSHVHISLSLFTLPYQHVIIHSPISACHYSLSHISLSLFTTLSHISLSLFTTLSHISMSLFNALSHISMSLFNAAMLAFYYTLTHISMLILWVSKYPEGECQLLYLLFFVNSCWTIFCFKSEAFSIVYSIEYTE